MFAELKNKFRHNQNPDEKEVEEKVLRSDEPDMTVSQNTMPPAAEMDADAPFTAELDEMPAAEVAEPEEPVVSLPNPAEEKALAVTEQSQLLFNEQVIERIAILALHDVDGVLAASGGGGFFSLKNSKGVTIEISDNQEVSVNMEVILEYGYSAPEIFENLKELITERLHDMTGLKVRCVNVRVVNVLTKEEFEGKS